MPVQVRGRALDPLRDGRGGAGARNAVGARRKCGSHAEMAVTTFGQALGALVLQKRRAKGLTQLQLAEDAFGSAGFTRRISELETGSVANPHAKTIDPIISCLDITEAELEACAAAARARPDENLDRAYREARNLIDAVARQFEHQQPDATLAELDAFLREKAKEWARLRQRISSLDTEDQAASDILKRAQYSLNNGDFDVVDSLLIEAEELHQSSKTLLEIRKQAEIRIARGYTKLLSNLPEEARRLFISSAEMFRAFDEIEMGEVLNLIAYDLYESSRRSYRINFDVAAALLELLITLDGPMAEKAAYSDAHYRLGLIYRNGFLHADEGEREDRLETAIDHATKAVESSDDDFRHVATRINLANCLMDKARQARSDEIFKKAIAIFADLRSSINDSPSAKALGATILNSLGSSILFQQDLIGHGDLSTTLNEAYLIFREAEQFSIDNNDIEVWGTSKVNIGNILYRQSLMSETSADIRYFLQIRSISEFVAAIETFPLEMFPARAADIQSNLAFVLFQYASVLNGPLRELYLFRAAQSYDIAKSAYEELKDNQRIASCQYNVARVYEFHAEFAEDREFDLQMAQDNYCSAKEIFESIGQTDLVGQCIEALNRIQNLLPAQEGESGDAD